MFQFSFHKFKIFWLEVKSRPESAENGSNNHSTERCFFFHFYLRKRDIQYV
jgi:hypothetical protein